MTLRIYVAGASAEIERCEAFIARLRAAGFEITFDWPAHIRKVGASNEGIDLATRKSSAEADIQAVRDAEWFVLLEPEEAKTIGAWVEMGVAIQAAIPVLWVGEGDRTIFSELADASVSNDENAFYFLMGLREQPFGDAFAQPTKGDAA